MAVKKINYHQNLQQNEIQNGVDQNLASAPSSPREGQFYWNTATKEDMIYNGTAWVSRTTQGTTYTEGDGIDITGTVISNTGVRSVSQGTSNGTISVNTGGTTANVSVKGLGSSAFVDTTNSVTSGESKTLTSGGAYTNLVRRKSTSAATGSTSQGVYVDANGQVQTCDAVTSTYSSSGTAPVNGQAVASAISSAISGVYKPSGSIAFANRPTLSASVLGNVYNITDSFTTTSDFVEGAGKTYPAGTNIVVVNTGTTASPTYKWDVLSGFIDLSPYQLTATAVTHTQSTAVGSATNPVYIASTGVATACTYSLNKTVPSDAVFTDTTYDVFTGATGSAAGTAGLVKAPAATDNTKFLKGNGTWAAALENTATGSNSLTILGTATTGEQSVNIGKYSSCTNDSGYDAWGVAIGYSAQAGHWGTAIGCNATANDANKTFSTAIGCGAKSKGNFSIQLGPGTNTQASSLYVALSNTNNYELLGSTGKIPNARLNLSTTPTSGSGSAITSGAVYTAITGMAKKLVATNGALTSTGGQCTWEITNTLETDECGVFVKEVSSNEYVDCYFEVTASKVTIKINSTSNIAASKYKAIIIG